MTKDYEQQVTTAEKTVGCIQNYNASFIDFMDTHSY